MSRLQRAQISPPSKYNSHRVIGVATVVLIRHCRTDLAADCLSRNKMLIKPAKQFVYKSRACVLHPHQSVSEYHIDTTERMEYTTIQKGRGYVYAHRNQLYTRVRTVGVVKYLKCCEAGCDGSAKLVAVQFFVGVSQLILIFDVFHVLKV